MEGMEKEKDKLTYVQYMAEVVKCDWCKQDAERKAAKHWITGARLCPKCYKEAEDKLDKFIEEFRKEMRQGTLYLESA